MTHINLAAVTYSYPNCQNPALDGVSLSVNPGEFVILAGGSGSGKSTFLRVCAGLVPHFYGGRFSGDATVNGISIRNRNPGDLSKTVGYLSQDPEAQIILGNVYSEIAFVLENLGHPRDSVSNAVENISQALGINELLDCTTNQLSGGELQRVALAAAMIHKPQILLLDEPTSQLDSAAAEEFLGLVRRISAEFGTTVLIAEHRLKRCLPHADRVISLQNGSVISDTSIEEFLAHTSTKIVSGVEPKKVLGDFFVPDLSQSLSSWSIRNPPTDGPIMHQNSDQTALKFSDVSLKLKNSIILRNVSFELKRGSTLALIGSNGAGKSTLLRVAAGIQKPTSGHVSKSGQIRLLLQNPNDHFIGGTVGQTLDKNQLVNLGFEQFTDRNPTDLSGGERQRLAIELVIGKSNRPAAILFDEPTRGVDSQQKSQFAAQIRALAETGIAVIVATHDYELVTKFADDVLLLEDGSPVGFGPVDDHLPLSASSSAEISSSQTING